MFTGITAGLFPVVGVERAPDRLQYTVQLSDELVAGLRIGASVAIDGVCQTVVSMEGQRVFFDAIKETLDKTTLGALDLGTRVAVERSRRVGDEIGGHDVAGHVVGTGRVHQVLHAGEVHELRIAVPAGWMKYILHKGFIAVDGSSLTVGSTEAGGAFTVHLIPETMRLTNLGKKQLGERVNIELDPHTVAIVDTVERVLAGRNRP